MFSDDLNACAAIVEISDPDRFIAVMAAPVAARRVLFPLFAFNCEVARAPWVTQEPLIAEMRLQWWRDALGEVKAGGSVRRHEVVTPLADVLDGAGADLLDQVIEARRWDIQSEPFEDEDALRAYLDATSGSLLWAGARALGATGEDTVRDVGFAAGLANWFRAIPELEARGRYPLPDGRGEAVQSLAREGLERLRRARAARRDMRKAAPVLLTAWQAGAVLKQAEKEPGRVVEDALGQSDVRRKGSLLLRSMTGRW